MPIRPGQVMEIIRRSHLVALYGCSDLSSRLSVYWVQYGVDTLASSLR